MGRSVKKGPYVDEKLLKKINVMKKGKKKTVIKTRSEEHTSELQSQA